MSEILHVCACILGLGSRRKKGREHKNNTALNLSFKIFKTRDSDLPECSATSHMPSGTEYWMESHLTCSQIFIFWHFVMRADLQKRYINATELSEMRAVATAPFLSTVVRSMGIAKYCCLL